MHSPVALFPALQDSLLQASVSASADASEQQTGFGDAAALVFTLAALFWQHCFTDFVAVSVDDDDSPLVAPVKAIPSAATAANIIASEMRFFMCLSFVFWPNAWSRCGLTLLSPIAIAVPVATQLGKDLTIPNDDAAKLACFHVKTTCFDFTDLSAFAQHPGAR